MILFIETGSARGHSVLDGGHISYTEARNTSSCERKSGRWVLGCGVCAVGLRSDVRTYL